MASTGKKGKKNKGKTVPLNDFLSNNTISWIDQVDEADKAGEFNVKPILPAAPRAARALELDESRIPKNPPYVAYLSNLSYELEETDILNAFSDLSISNVRLPRDERSGRLKGFGYVEFSDRSSFIAALQKHEATITGRRIKIDVAENEGERRRGGMRDNRDRDSNYESERTLGDWRSGSRAEFSDDRRGPGRRDYGDFRDRDRDRDGMDRGRGDRDSSWRSSERSFGGDRDRDRDSRGNYGSRRGYNDSESNYSEPKTRTKLNLKPRTLPVEELLVVKEEPVKKERPEKPSAASIFGQAKPVDTAAREREIEERLARERVKSKGEKDVSKLSDGENSGTETKGTTSVPKENVWVRKSLKSETDNDTSRGPSSEKADDLDEPPPAEESEKEIPDESLNLSHSSENKRSDEYDSEGESRYSRSNRNDSRYNDKNRESDRSYRRDDRDRRDRREDDRDRRDRREDDRDRRDRREDDRDRRDRREDDRDRRDRREDDRDRRDRREDDRDRRDRREDDRDRRDRREDDRDRRDRRDDRRDRGYDSDRRGGRSHDRERDGESRRYSERDNEHKRFTNDRDGENKRFSERDVGRQRDHGDHGNNKMRGERRGGFPGNEKNKIKSNQERERGPLTKEKPKEPRKSEDGIRMPKLRESEAPNYIGTNKYSFLEEDGVSE